MTGQAAMFGASIWRQLTHVVELRDNIRAKEDPVYIALLAWIRIGEGTSQCSIGCLNYNILKTRIIEWLSIENYEDYQKLCNAPVVFGERCL